MANLFESTAEAIWIRYFENHKKFEKKKTFLQYDDISKSSVKDL